MLYVGTACHSGKFDCGDGKCINSSLRCDGDFDCKNHADEYNCGKFTCSCVFILIIWTKSNFDFGHLDH